MTEDDRWILRYLAAGWPTEKVAVKMGMTEPAVRERVVAMAREEAVTSEDMTRRMDSLTMILCEQHKLLGDAISDVTSVLASSPTLEEIQTVLSQCPVLDGCADYGQIAVALKRRFILLRPPALPKKVPNESGQESTQ